MDDEQRNIKIQPRTAKDHWGDEFVIKWDGKDESLIGNVGWEKKTDNAEPRLKFG